MAENNSFKLIVGSIVQAWRQILHNVCQKLAKSINMPRRIEAVIAVNVIYTKY